MFNPVSIPDIFNDVVSNASTALGLTLNYKFGSWKVINEELKNSQNDKFHQSLQSLVMSEYLELVD